MLGIIHRRVAGILVCILGLSDPLLSKMAKCGKSRTDSHICRNLHTTIRRFKTVLGVNVSTVATKIRLSKRRPDPVSCAHPVLHLSSWAECIFDAGGHFFLGGNDLDSFDTFRVELETFWSRFLVAEPTFPRLDESEWGFTIPMAIHGDEGRGRGKLPVLVASVQTLMPICPGRTNLAGIHSCTSHAI